MPVIPAGLSGGGGNVGNLMVRLLGDSSSYQKMLRQAGVMAEKMGAKLRRVGRSMSMYVTAPIVAMGAASVKAFASFDQAMTESTSIMKVTEKQTARMRETALSLSKKGVQGPSELARSYYDLASAGLDAEQAMGALPIVMDFATAGAFDMSTATDLLTDVQSALGMVIKDDVVKNMENMLDLSDALVKANTLANASVQQFSTALTSKAGSSMKAMNISLEQGIAVLAAYADQGIKAELAGNAFDRLIRLLTKAIADNAEEFEKWNIKVFEDGQFRGFEDIIGDMEKALGHLTPEAKAAALATLGFEARVQAIILPLLGSSKSIRNFYEELADRKGISTAVAKKQLESFTNQLKMLWNQVKVAGIRIGETLVPAIKVLMGWLQKGLGVWESFNTGTKKAAVIIAAVVAAIGPSLIALGAMLTVLGSLMTLITPFTSALALAAASVGLLAARMGWASQATGWFGKQWENLVDSIQPAIDDIKNALAGNDVKLAFEIAWAQIQLTFAEGIQPLTEMWIGFVHVFKNVWVEAVSTIKSVWSEAVTNLSTAMAALDDANDQAKLSMWGWTGMSDRQILGHGPRDLNETLKVIEGENTNYQSQIDEDKRKALENAQATASTSIQLAQGNIDRLKGKRDQLTSQASDAAAKEVAREQLETFKGFLKGAWGVAKDGFEAVTKEAEAEAGPVAAAANAAKTGAAIGPRAAVGMNTLEGKQRVAEYRTRISGKGTPEKQLTELQKINDNTKKMEEAIAATPNIALAPLGLGS